MEISGKKLAGALLAAAAIGATIGILNAPAKGKETRRKIADKANDVKKKFNDLVDELKCEYEEAMEKARDYSETGKA